MKMKKMILAVMVLVALAACKSNVKEQAEVIDLPRAETPDSVAVAMEGFFRQAAQDSMDIHSVMIVKDGQVIYSHWQSQGAAVRAASVPTVPEVSISSWCPTRMLSSPLPLMLRICRES